MRSELFELCRLNGVSGDENVVREYIREKAAPYADSMRTDAMGNLIVFKKGKKSTGNKLLIAAHMDEVGLIVTRITDDGFLKFDFVGGVDRRVAIGKPVRLGPEGVPGIIGLKAIHLVKRDEMKKTPKTDALYVDIGAKNREEALKLVQPGTYGSFVGEPEEFGDGMLKAKAIDDRAGCAIMLDLIRQELPMDVTFAFTVQEEVGTRGAQVAAQTVKPDIAIVFEGSPADDTFTPDYLIQTALGKGPMLRHIDARMITNPRFIRYAIDLGEELGIPVQEAVRTGGSTNGAPIHLSNMGVPVIVVGLPVRYIHTHHCYASFCDFENSVKLAVEIIKRLNGDIIKSF